MKRFPSLLLAMSVTAIALVSTAPASAAESATGDAACPAVLNYTFNRLQTGKPESLCQFRGKVLLIVNTASYCGYTHQYEGLEALYRRYKSRGLVVVGFPSNDFGAQEPGTNQEIAEFCRLTYGVQFPMFEKTSVTSLKTNPLYATLLARTGQAPQWNFHKYLVDRNGNRVESFGSKVEPDDRALLTALEKLLSDKSASPAS
jgi:glutathione peroxidase